MLITALVVTAGVLLNPDWRWKERKS